MWGLMAGLPGLLAMGARLQSRDQLITMEAPGLPRYHSSIQFDAVVTFRFAVNNLLISVLTTDSLCKMRFENCMPFLNVQAKPGHDFLIK